MKHVSLSNNITFVFNRSVYDDFGTQEVEEKIKTVYSGQDPEVGSTSFPNEIKAVFSTNLQIQIVGQGKTVIIADTKINEANEISSTDTARLALSIYKLMLEKALVGRMFGFNFIFSYQDVAFDAVQNKIKAKYFKSDLNIEDAEIKFALPNISYEIGTARYTLKFDIEPDEDGVPSKVSVACNVHFDNIEDLSDDTFVDVYKQSYKHVYEALGEIND